MRRLAAWVLGLGVLALAVLVGGALISLDWDREHTARTAALPLLADARADGLVRIAANGLEFRARVAGLGGGGPGLVLLHGFPETSAMWIPLIDAAAAAGFRVVAFDQRGYSPGARPEGAQAYTVAETSRDVLAIADAVGFERFHLVGHDWGCVVGWVTTVQHPDRIRSWAALSIPHPGPMLAEMRADPPAYIRVFQTPWLPELLFGFADFALLRAGRPELAEEVRAEYDAAFSEPGALSAALDWYRAIPGSLDAALLPTLDVQPPTLFIYGAREGWARGGRLEQQRPLMRGPYEELELDAGHWLMQEQTERVVGAILAHLGRAVGAVAQ